MEKGKKAKSQTQGRRSDRGRRTLMAALVMVAISGLLSGTQAGAEDRKAPASGEEKVLSIRISGRETAPVPFDRTRLMPGTNFSIGSGGMAYNTREVREWTKGLAAYEGGKIAFLTFDDGPAKNTGQVLDILKQRKVPATFFLNGKSVDTYKDRAVLGRYIAEGHGIATHSYTHVYGYLYPGKVARADRHVEEYEKSLAAMKRVFGESFESKVYRYPGGSGSWKGIHDVNHALRSRGVEHIDWNCMSGDAEPGGRKPGSPQAMGEYVLKTLRDNTHQDVAVVLMHDTLSATPAYLHLVIDALEGEGFAFGILR